MFRIFLGLFLLYSCQKRTTPAPSANFSSTRYELKIAVTPATSASQIEQFAVEYRNHQGQVVKDSRQNLELSGGSLTRQYLMGKGQLSVQISLKLIDLESSPSTPNAPENPNANTSPPQASPISVSIQLLKSGILQQQQQCSGKLGETLSCQLNHSLP